jgi:hypothetical protein
MGAPAKSLPAGARAYNLPTRPSVAFWVFHPALKCLLRGTGCDPILGPPTNKSRGAEGRKDWATLPELLTQTEVNALRPGTAVMVLAPRLHSQPRRCVIRKRRSGRRRHGHEATEAHTLFNSEGEPLGAEFFYTRLEGVGKGTQDIHVWLEEEHSPALKQKCEPS